MPARVIQRVDSVPADEFRSICLECSWLGDIGDEPGVARQAYSHNQAHHDGAGVEAQISDILGPDTDTELAHYRRMFRTGMFSALACLVSAMFLIVWGRRDLFIDTLVGIQVFSAAVNAFMAGKWALRIETVTFALERLGAQDDDDED